MAAEHDKAIVTTDALAARLRDELALEAAQAPADHQKLYRWLLETADAGRPMPRWGRRPHYAKIGVEMGVVREGVGDRYGSLLNRWYPRFLEAFDPSRVLVNVPYAMPVILDRGTAVELRDPEARAALLRDLRDARERQPDDLKLAFDFLIARAEMSSGIPTHGRRPNIRAIAGMMKVSYDTVRPFTEIFTFWLERFGGEPSNSIDRRRTLPGTKLTGTSVPVGLLLKLMKQDLKKEDNEQAHRLLSHLIKVAEGDRTVPRFNGRPARSRILADAGVETEFSPAAVKSVYDAWIEFFRIDDHYSFQGVDGAIRERSVLEEEARQYVARLRADGLRPLLRDSRSPSEISFAAINRDLNREGRGIGSGGARRVLLAYRAECAAHRGDDGMGEPYGGRPLEEAAARTARRNALLGYCRKELAAGRRLPGRPGNPKFLDHDELERRFNKPGPSLAGDNRFATLLRKLRPEFEPYDATLVPTTYGQLIAEVQAHRVPAGTAEASATVLRSRLKTAIEAYARAHHKDVTSLVADDFSEEAFGAAVATVMATQKVAKTFATDIGRVRSFLDKRKSDANDRNDFHTALANAVRGSGLSVAAVASETGASSGQLDHWIRRTQAPSAAHVETITRIELRLGLPEGELTGKIGARPGSYGQWPTRLPERIRAFLPDDFMEKDPDEVKAMIHWINDNLIHQNSAFARTIADLQRKSHAKRKEQSRQPEEDDRNYQADVDANDEDEDVERFEEGDDETGVQSDAAKSAMTSALENQLAHETRGLGRTIVGELRELIIHMTSFIVTNRLRRPGSHWKHESTAPMRLSMLARFMRWQVDAEEEGGLGRDPSAVTLADLIHPPLVLAYLDHRVRRNSNSERSGKAPRFTGSDVDMLRTVRSLVDPEYGFVTNYEGMSTRSREDRRPLSEGSFIGLDGHVFGKDENKKADLEEQKSVGVRSRDPDIMPLECTNLKTRAFREQCTFASKVYASAAQQIDTYAEAGRDPVEPIVGLLDSDAPMTTLLRQLALASHRTPPIEVDARLHHLHIRDLLLCRLFALTTLRQKNMRQITVTGPEPKLTKEVVTVGGKRGVKKEEERWTLEIHFAEFKNFRNTTLFGRRRKRQPYRKHLPDSHGLYKLMAYYLDVTRPYFVKRRQRGAVPNELFLSSTGKALSGPETWRAVSRFTARHVAWNPFRNEGVPKVMPFGPHAFRDVRATDILLNPRTANPYLEAALALQTSPGMIQAHYGVIRPERRTALDDHTFIDRENEAWRNIAEPDFG